MQLFRSIKAFLNKLFLIKSMTFGDLIFRNRKLDFDMLLI